MSTLCCERQAERTSPRKPEEPHISRSDAATFHLFLEESIVSRASGANEQHVAALFWYEFDPKEDKSESTLVTIRPAGLTEQIVLGQLELSADRLAAILGQANRLQKT